MGFYSNPDRPRGRPSRLRLFFIAMLIYGGIKVFGAAHLHPFQPAHISSAPLAPVVVGDGIPDENATGVIMLHLGGRRVWGNGTSIDLGDRHTHLPASLLSRFFPDRFNLTSCLTESPAPAVIEQKPLLVRDDWPGFYGAPWIARLDGSLIVLLNVFAPRNTRLPVPAPEFQIYPSYDGQKQTPALSGLGSARFYRGSKAVLYRVFLTGPVRCLDLVVQNGENYGRAYLYYQKYHHFYQSEMTFVIQQ